MHTGFINVYSSIEDPLAGCGLKPATPAKCLSANKNCVYFKACSQVAANKTQQLTHETFAVYELILSDGAVQRLRRS